MQDIPDKKIKKKHAKKIVKTQLSEAMEVEEILQLVNIKEFGPGESPLRELVTVGVLLQQGVSVNEVFEFP